METFLVPSDTMKQFASSREGKARFELAQVITQLLANDRDPMDDSTASKMLADILWNARNGAIQGYAVQEDEKIDSNKEE